MVRFNVGKVEWGWYACFDNHPGGPHYLHKNNELYTTTCLIEKSSTCKCCGQEVKGKVDTESGYHPFLADLLMQIHNKYGHEELQINFN